jgi:hypothetical protein
MVPLTASEAPSPLPAAGLPPEALGSLRRAFARDVRIRLPRLLEVVREGSGSETLELGRSDAHHLAEGCALLGDAAGARALRRLESLLREGADRTSRLYAADQSALLLGRWTADDRTERAERSWSEDQT